MKYLLGCLIALAIALCASLIYVWVQSYASESWLVYHQPSMTQCFAWHGEVFVWRGQALQCPSLAPWHWGVTASTHRPTGPGLVAIPIWPFVAALLACSFCTLRPFLPHYRRRQRRRRGLCEHCGYNLRGLTEARCPECGRDTTIHEGKERMCQ